MNTAMRAAVSANTEAAELSPLQVELLRRDGAGDGVEPRCISARITGQLDERALVAALESLVARHDVLHTAFTIDAGEARARRVEPSPVRLHRIDLRRFEPAERDAALLRIARDQLQRGLDPGAGQLARAALFRIADDSALLLLVVHALAADEAALRGLARHLSVLYRAARAGTTAEDGGPTAAQGETGSDLDRVLAGTAEALRGAPPVLDIPTDRARSAQGTCERRSVAVELPAAVASRVGELAQGVHASVDDVLLAGLQALLVRLCAQDDIVLGVEVRGVTTAGALAELAPVRIDASGDPSFAELVTRARDELGRAAERASVPLDWILAALGETRNPSYHPLYQVAFSGEPDPAQLLELDGAIVEPFDLHDPAALDLRLRLVADGERIRGWLSYRTDLFYDQSAARIARRLEHMLADAVARPQTRISELDLLPPAERRLLLTDWNATGAPAPTWRTVHEIYETQAVARPDAPAVADLARALSYGELNLQANRLAHRLRRLGVAPEKVVGVAIPRSVEAVIAFLGVLKAGGAYLPLDPTYPRDRLEYMLGHAGVSVVVTSTEVASAVPPHSRQTVLLDGGALAGEPETDPHVAISGDCLAYVIYTSGSTGRPKGVELAHRGACNLASALRTMFGLDETDRVAFFSSLNFDASVWEMLMAVGCGACLCVVETAGRSAAEIASDLRELRVTAGTFPPSFLRAAAGAELPSLELVVSAGEQCTAELVRAWGVGRRFVNAYGPTEATVCSTWAPCDASVAGAPPIGKPLPNVRAYVLDAHRQPTAIGARGELFVAGAGISRGYRNSPRQTAEVFVPDPFGRPGSRLYRTGDVVTFLPSGDLQYVARTDGQVKLRGFRVEPGEIGATLARHPDVADAAVGVRESSTGEPQLVAWVVLEPDARARVARSSAGAAGDELRAEFRDFLQRTLPPYMLPSRYVLLDALPLSPSGKVDHAALEELDTVDAAQADELPDAQTPTEEVIARIWAENLGLGRVGRHDDFLEIGGHSLIAAQVIADVRDAFEIQLPVRVLFEYPVLAEFAVAVDEARVAALVAG